MIGRSGMYGIRAMLMLTRLEAEEYAGAARIAATTHVPQSYLSKLLQTLSRAGLVESQRGVKGGFRLARAACEISLYDIMESLEPIERWSGCFLGNAECSEEHACAMHSRWRGMQHSYLTMLRESTLAELVNRSEHSTDLLEQSTN